MLCVVIMCLECVWSSQSVPFEMRGQLVSGVMKSDPFIMQLLHKKESTNLWFTIFHFHQTSGGGEFPSGSERQRILVKR